MILKKGVFMSLADSRAREQVTEELLDFSIFIEAGAGTGKSSTLVSRIVNTIRRSEAAIPIEAIAAITFTEKAGAELNNRLREGLLEALLQNPGNQAIQQALDNLDAASIGTIHSFAQTILREHALSAGIPLGFTLSSDAVAKSARADRVRGAIGCIEAELDADDLSVLALKEITWADMRELVTQLDEGSVRLSDAAFVADGTERIEALIASTINDLEIFAKDASESCHDHEDLLFTKMMPDLIEVIRQLKALQTQQNLTAHTAVEKFSGLSLSKLGSAGAAKNWTGTPKEWRDRYSAFKLPVAQLNFGPAEIVIRRALAIAWNYLADCRKERARKGELEFDDLLIFTRQLLASNPEVRRYVHDQFQVVMVDEFQDTDPLQWEIVRLITSDPEDQFHRPSPGRLIVVGDPKQAIYSFRGADVSTYLESRKQFSADGENLGQVVSLTTNFRTVKPIISFINSVFTPSFNGENTGQVDYTPLTPHHDPSDPDPGQSVLIVRDPVVAPDDVAEYDSKKMEPRQIAYAISLAISKGWKITERDDDRNRHYTRQAAFSDVTILYPARTGRDRLLTALDDFGIPYRSSDAGLVYSRSVVKGVIASLHYCLEGEANLDLWLALKSPLFACSDADLLHFRTEGGRWHAWNENPKSIVSAGLKLLKEVKKAVARRTPVELIDDLISKTRILEALPYTNRGAFEAECLRMMRAHAQEWQDNGGVGLYEYLQWIDAVIDEAYKISLPEPDDRDDNAVRLMTMFQAKGLEFPIVAIAGMSHAPYSVKPTFGISTPAQYEFRLSNDEQSCGYTDWLDLDYIPKEKAEDVRLLYVACTRARDHLILSLAGELGADKKDGEARKQQPYSRLLTSALPHEPEHITTLPTDLEAFQTTLRDAAKPLPVDWVEKVRKIQQTSRIRWVSSPSGVGAVALGVDPSSPLPIDEPAPTEIEQISDAPDGRRDGTAIGQSVHRSLDVLVREIDPSTQRIAHVCGEFAEEEGAMSHLESIQAMVQHALVSEVVVTAQSSSQLWTELYLAAPVSYQSVQVVDGLADLVYRDADGLHIIDYKTDAVIKQSDMNHYREQLHSYRELIQRATGTSEISTAILHLSESGSQLIPV
jgi:ATP-dependent helicase/nuclease subunit A